MPDLLFIFMVEKSSVAVAEDGGLLDACLHVVLVAGVGAGDVHEEAGVDDIVPAEAADDVAPVVGEVEVLVFRQGALRAHAGVSVVITHIEGGVESTALVEGMRHLGVDVVEIIACRQLGLPVVIGGQLLD